MDTNGFEEVIFTVICPYTFWGDHVAVVGSCAELGSWNPQKGLELTTSADTFPQWQGRVCLPIGHHELKFVIVRRGSVEWETNANRPCVANVPMEVLAKFHDPDTKVVSLAPRAEERQGDRREMPSLLGRLGPGKVQATGEVKDKTMLSPVDEVTCTSVLKIQRWWKKQVVEKAVLFELLVRELYEVRLEAALQIQKMWQSKLIGLTSVFCGKRLLRVELCLVKFHDPDTKLWCLVCGTSPKWCPCPPNTAEERDRSEEMPSLLGRLGPGKVQATGEVKDKRMVSSVDEVACTSVLKIQRWWKKQVIEKAVLFELLVRELYEVRLEAALQVWRRKCETSLSPAATEDEIFFG
eukprot:symbB.v1.2.017927.t1/scaffold1406.1/size338231/6